MLLAGSMGMAPKAVGRTWVREAGESTGLESQFDFQIIDINFPQNAALGGLTLWHYTLLKFLLKPTLALPRLHHQNIQRFPNSELEILLPLTIYGMLLVTSIKGRAK